MPNVSAGSVVLHLRESPFSTPPQFKPWWRANLSIGGVCCVVPSCWWHLVSSPYQLSEDVSCFPHPEELLYIAVLPACPSRERQHGRDILSQQGTDGPMFRNLNQKAREMIVCSIGHQLCLIAVHISGVGTVEPDCLARCRVGNYWWTKLSVGWSLDMGIAHSLFAMWGNPTVNLFCAQQNLKVTAFYAWLSDQLGILAHSLQVDGPRIFQKPLLPNNSPVSVSWKSHMGISLHHKVGFPGSTPLVELLLLPECDSLLLGSDVISSPIWGHPT